MWNTATAMEDHTEATINVKRSRRNETSRYSEMGMERKGRKTQNGVRTVKIVLTSSKRIKGNRRKEGLSNESEMDQKRLSACIDRALAGCDSNRMGRKLNLINTVRSILFKN